MLPSGTAAILGLEALAEVVEHALQPVVVTSTELTRPGPIVLYANQAMTAMTGYGYDELVGRSPRILQGPKTDRAELERMRRELTAGSPFLGRVINYRKDGSEFVLEWRIIRVEALDRRAYYVSLQRDVTEDVRLRDELERSKAAKRRDLRLVTARESSLRETEQSRDMLRAVIEASGDAFILVRKTQETPESRAFTVIDCNTGAERMLGRVREQLIGVPWSSLEGPAGIGDPALLDKAYKDEVVRTEISTKETLWHRRSIMVVADCVAVNLRDVTHDYRLSEQVRQGQKMEALGRLAGSVAHDFNNMLSAILGFSRLAQAQVPHDHPAHLDLGEVIAAGERSAALTQQLLAFSRRQVLAPRVIDAAKELGASAGVLRRLVGESIALLISIDGPVCVKVDPTQLEQVVLNLVINARDATPAGGTIKVVLEARSYDATASKDLAIPAGDYAVLSVTDTGHGMSEEVQAQMFEPFFTTKERGRGTGLGLSTVFGIVRQSGGHIRVKSTVGHGTSILVFLPLASGDPWVAKEPAHSKANLQGRTALVVDDEPAVRAVCARVLRAAGMLALEAEDGDQALEVDRSHGGVIDVLLTDVVMPRMHGRLLADVLRARRPALKVLYMSGYTEDIMLEHGVDPSHHLNILPKPVDGRALVERIRDLVVPSPD